MEQRLHEEEEKLRLYIAYKDKLYADQLSKALSSLERLYDCLYISQAPELSLPLPLETRMCIDECRTGHSIEVLLSEGVRQILDPSGPIIQILAPTGVVGAMVLLILRYAKGFAEFRKTWYEGSQQKHIANKEMHEANKAEYEAERLKNEIQREERERKLNQIHFDLSIVPTERKQQASEAIADFFYVMEDAPNIIRVRVNDIVVLDNQPNMQSPQSKGGQDTNL